MEGTHVEDRQVGGADVDARTPTRWRAWLRTVLVGFGDSCARVGVALLACLALIAVGTVASLLWTVVAER